MVDRFQQRDDANRSDSQSGEMEPRWEACPEPNLLPEKASHRIVLSTSHLYSDSVP